jgi:hypothetical protein
MTRYVVYRNGSNAANQGMIQRMAVALVNARNAAEACETEACSPGTPYATSRLKLARDVQAYSNQHFDAVAESRAPKADVRRLEEDDHMKLEDIEIGMRVHGDDCAPEDADQGYVTAINYETGMVEVAWDSCQSSEQLACGLKPGDLPEDTE